MVDCLGVFCDFIAAYIANDFENFLVIVHSVVEVGGRIVEFFGIGVVAFAQLDNLAHQRVIEVMLKTWVVCIEISHCLLGVFLVIFDELGHNIFHVAGNNIVGYSIDRSVGVVVYRDDNRRFLHTCDMLNLTGDAASDV